MARASRAFRALRKAVFLDINLWLSTKKKIYNACVMSVLLYGVYRVLGSSQEAQKETGYIPPSMHLDNSGPFQQTAVV